MKYWRSPIDQGSINVSRGRVIIIEERCKGCELCVIYCPRDVLRMSSSFNIKGYHYPESIDEIICINCHFCEALCPEFSIFSIENKEES